MFNKAVIVVLACVLGTGLLLISIEAIVTGIIESPSDYRYDGDVYYFAISPINFLFWLTFYTSSSIFSFLVPIRCMDSIFPVKKDNSEKFKNSKKNKKLRRREQLKTQKENQ
ncbi:hypothetical protein CXF74_07985 [Psychromonas sp. Urea-02u-13]|nr:hypothetical protein CXF74_07985 [Psychromonas sp. Urea-02u-13]